MRQRRATYIQQRKTELSVDGKGAVVFDMLDPAANEYVKHIIYDDYYVASDRFIADWMHRSRGGGNRRSHDGRWMSRSRDGLDDPWLVLLDDHTPGHCAS